MGILDKKTRFIDLIVTEEGRRQIANGRMRAEYASFSDCNAFYDINEKDNVSQRLYFEVANRPENVIVFEKDDSGRIVQEIDPTLRIVGNSLFKQDEGESQSMSMVTGSVFQSVFTGSLSEAITRNFQNNYFLINSSSNVDNINFEINKNELTFTITNNQPFENSPYKEIINVNDAEPFFIDPKLTYLDAFQFLPPKNVDGSNYGIYRDIRSTTQETWSEIKDYLGVDNFKKEQTNPENELNLINNNEGEIRESRLLLDNGQLPVNPPPPKLVETLKIEKTSIDNNFIMQIYENSEGSKLTKLDIVDAGVFYDQTDPNQRFEKRVLYVGKIYNDDFNMPTFASIFTIVMD